MHSQENPIYFLLLFKQITYNPILETAKDLESYCKSVFIFILLFIDCSCEARYTSVSYVTAFEILCLFNQIRAVFSLTSRLSRKISIYTNLCLFGNQRLCVLHAVVNKRRIQLISEQNTHEYNMMINIILLAYFSVYC